MNTEVRHDLVEVFVTKIEIAAGLEIAVVEIKQKLIAKGQGSSPACSRTNS